MDKLKISKNKGGNVMQVVNNDNKIKNQDRLKDSMDEGFISDPLNSDNAFNDSGLENVRLLNKAMKKGKSE